MGDKAVNITNIAAPDRSRQEPTGWQNCSSQKKYKAENYHWERLLGIAAIFAAKTTRKPHV
jgi:hypothetical protein